MIRILSTTASLLAGTLLIAACADTPTAPSLSSGRALLSEETGDGGQATLYSGEATVLDATVLGNRTTLGHVGPLPSEGGEAEYTALTLEEPGLLRAEVAHAATVAGGDQAHAEASLADLRLTVAGQTIEANFLMAEATATCGPNGVTLRGRSHIARLRINGMPVHITGQPNQVVSLPGGGTLAINEQEEVNDGSYGEMTVTALRVSIPGVAEVVIASAHADIGCTDGETAGPGGGDFVTGGGWIVGTPSGARGTFGVGGGIKKNGLWGHLTYMDHGQKRRVKATEITHYCRIGNTATISGEYETNQEPSKGTFTVVVTDNGEPGDDDYFEITLVAGGHVAYAAKGTLIGGNIQTHGKPSCG